MRLIALLTGFFFFAAVPTGMAAEAKKADTAAGTSVEMPYLIAPLSDGTALVAYAYVSSKIIGSSPASALEIKGKIPFIQDAFVRDVNAATIGKPDNPTAVDNTTLEPRMLALVKKVMGPGKVADLKLIEVQIVPIRPGATPSASPS